MMKCFKSKTSSLLGAHEVWVGSHSGLARNLETTLYVAPQLVPKRVMEPEVATQLGYSLMGLLHLYHDYVVWKKESADKDPPTGSHKCTDAVGSGSTVADFARASAGGSRCPPSRRRRRQVASECVGGGSEGCAPPVLLAQNRRAMMLRGGKYKDVEYAPRPSAFARFKKPKQPGARTGKTFGKPAVSEPEPMKEKSAEEDSNKIMFELRKVREGTSFWLEVSATFCGPSCMEFCVVTDRRPRTPVIASLFVELSGLALSAAAVKPAEPKMPVSAEKARDEIAARKMALILYLLRDPVLATVTKPATGKVGF
ncbi:hypothetical protein PF010_g29347 [Phytophthora fragariae]|uniref:Peroxisomal membrane protein PEX16 n=1 Tax=Phytophthora fragariae TaxID=53985 RepID=A0A6G0JNY1_9STRA|nr:hypothetical protein PF010_g29347 [Phytophthora fragariae]